MTKSHIDFELSATSPPIVIPARKVPYRASVPETRMSPITGNPVFDSNKQLTINSHLSSKSGSLESNHISSSPTTLTLLENNHIDVSPLSSNSVQQPSYSSSYSSPPEHILANGFRSTTMLPSTLNSKFETSRSPYGSSSRTRSLSYTKGTRGSLTVGVNHTSALARNPFGDCEIFTTDVLKPLIESNAKKSTNDSKKSPDEELGSSKPTVSQEKTEKRLRRKSSWDIVELLALDNFRNWMVCFCVVNFDLELGQAIDSMYPPLELGDEEKKSICFSAFPDSNSFDVGDTVFSFRIRCSKSGLVASGPTADAGFLYGYVFFRQKKDPKIRRGYFQKSLVLLSQYPFVGLFSRVVSILGPSYFEVGKPMLEAACHNIASWKSPSPGKLFDLPFLGYVIQVEIPQSNKPQLLETSPFDMSNYRPELQILASLPPTPMFTHFRGMIKDLWLCWELMLFAEPIVLIAPDPKVCSESVIELMDIINPIPYCGDYRPYFTIQDSDFKTFVTKNRPPSNVIIGVTNPFFTKALQHWPNIIRVGVGKPRTRKTYENSWRGLHASTLDVVQGVTSKRKSVIAKDKAILKKLAEAIARGYPPDYLLNNILRRYFVDLTEKFLVPLNRYFSTLIPFHITLSSQESPQLKPFKTDSFLKSLQEHGPQIPFKAKNFPTNTTNTYVNFYTQFLKCGNFATWLRQRTIEAQNELRKRYLQVLCEDDVQKWIIGKHEMELVDLLVRIRDELKLSSQQDSASSQLLPPTAVRDNDGGSSSTLTAKQREKLRLQASIIISGLPRDLRESFTADI